MLNKQLWYTRRSKEIRGPYPAGLITRYILLGRILETDELSNDQISWEQVAKFPELIPPELKLDLTVPENNEKLRIARMREDERETLDRRGNANHKANHIDSHYDNNNDNPDTNFIERRSDRRVAESEEVVRHREIRTKLLESLRQKQKENYVQRIIGLFFVFTIILWFSLSYG